MIRVYVAGAISNHGKITSDKEIQDNVYAAIDVGDKLLRHGFIPFVPHLNYWWGERHRDHDNDRWMAWDYHWLNQCHVMCVVPGEITEGVQKEIAIADLARKPVYYQVHRLIDDRRSLENRFLPPPAYPQLGTIPELMADAIPILKTTACEECTEDTCWKLGGICMHYCHGLKGVS